MYLEGQLPLGPDSSNLGGVQSGPELPFEAGGPLIGNGGDPSANGRGGANTFFMLQPDSGGYSQPGGDALINGGRGGNGAAVINGGADGGFGIDGLFNLLGGGVEAVLSLAGALRGRGTARINLDGTITASAGGGIDSGVNGSAGVGGGGDVMISPSLATANEVVQAPYTEPKNAPYKPLTGYDACGSYAADGSLVSLRNRTMRTGLGGMCQSGEQVPTPDTVPNNNSIWGLLAVLGVIVVLGDN